MEIFTGIFLTLYIYCNKMPEKIFVWDEAKNERLKRTRGVGFEDVARAFAERGSLWIRDNPKPEKYPRQKLLAVLIDDYVYVAPYEEDR